jgi:hypothetical protein
MSASELAISIGSPTFANFSAALSSLSWANAWFASNLVACEIYESAYIKEEIHTFGGRGKIMPWIQIIQIIPSCSA